MAEVEATLDSSHSSIAGKYAGEDEEQRIL
jgi:hypothetical protein